MDLVSILWLLVAACALVFAADAFVLRFARKGAVPSPARRSVTAFGVLMVLLALACVAMAFVDPLGWYP